VFLLKSLMISFFSLIRNEIIQDVIFELRCLLYCSLLDLTKKRVKYKTVFWREASSKIHAHANLIRCSLSKICLMHWSWLAGVLCLFCDQHAVTRENQPSYCIVGSPKN
jgi:hypothetical protein